MNAKVPSSLLISTWLALVMALFYAILNSLSGNPTRGLIYDSLLFFFIAFVVLAVVLEWLVFRKLKALNLINQREIRKLKDMEAYRREFLGEVSHELKTPIFAIQGFIHTLIDGAINDEKVRMKFLKKAMKNSDRLSSLVEDLLIITQAESGEMEMKIRHFNIYDLVQDVVDLMEYKFTKKKRDISCEVISDGLEEAMVLADRERIQQVLSNLVDNAVKYGRPDGELKIKLQDKGRKIMVSVIDNGPGIDPDHLEKIFRRFYRVDKSRSREKGGTGLGLAICKHLLEAHGETITVSSQVGEGTTFSFSLKRGD